MHIRHLLALRALPALLALALLAPGSAPAAVAAASEPTVSVFPEDFRVEPGTTVRFDIYAADGPTALRSVSVRLPFDRSLLEPVDSEFTGDEDWVSGLSHGTVVVTYGPLRKRENRRATLFFRVRPDVPSDTLIRIKPTFSWHSDTAEGKGDANAVRVLVLPPQAGQQQSVEPLSAPAGAPRVFAANRFAPREPLAAWLNLPGGGTLALAPDVAADVTGEVRLAFDAVGLPPGWYSMVLFGTRSRQTLSLPFEVQ